MKGRRSPIDKMRELADDGLEPWQIAAALGVREDAVLVALAADEPAGGAQRAVEDASSLVPAKPDTLAPTRPMTRALAEHVAVTVCGPDDVDETGAGEPELEFDADDASTYPCATGGDCGCTGTGLTSCPGGDEDRLEAARRARDEAADRFLDALAVANSATAAELEARLGDLDSAAEVVDEPAPEPVEVVEFPNGWTMPASLWGDVVARVDALVDELVDTPAELDPEHVHDPFPVVDETGVWHAECECGTRWDRSPCEYSGCTAYVAALHIARTGTSRHAHHPPA